ncbi:MAG: PAS domain S-box protein [Methanomicrobiales archaeon]|nr:PAS domain S-box protein [Methanomicrobiales archaeon]
MHRGGGTRKLSSRDSRSAALRDLFQERAAETVRGREHVLRALIDSALDAIVVLDWDGTVLFTNRAGAALAGFGDPGDAIGRNVLGFVHPHSFPSVLRDIERVKGGEGGILNEYRIQNLKGEERWIEGLGTKIAIAGTEAILVNLRDITARKRLEQALREEEARFRSVVQNSSDLITMVDGQGRILYESPATRRILGYPAGKRVGASIFDYVHGDDRAAVREAFARAVTEPGTALSAPFRIRHEDGSWVYLESTGSNLLDDPSMRCLVIASRDITERKRAEEALKRRDAILEALTFSAHAFLRNHAVSASIPGILEVLGRAADVSRVCICACQAGSDGGARIRRTFAWKAPGIAPPGEDPQDPRWEGGRTPLLRQVLEQGRTAAATLADLAPADREVLEPQGIRSLVLVPIRAGGSVWGFIGFDECRCDRVWTFPEIKALEAVADLVGSGIVREQMEEKLRESSERLRFALAASGTSIWEWDIRQDRISGLTDLEPAFRALTDMYPVTFERFRSLIHPGDRPRIDEAVRKTIREADRDSSHRETFRIGLPAGEVRWIEVHAKAVFDASGRAERVIGTARDITARRQLEEEVEIHRRQLERLVASQTVELTRTVESLRREIREREQAERALQKREEFLNDIFHSIQDGISILDCDMSILRVNHAMEEWYAHCMPLAGKKCYEAYHGREQPCEACPSLRTLATGEPAHGTVRKSGPGGEAGGWLDLHSFPLVDERTGALSGVIEYVRDISERKRIENALRESEEKYRSLFNEDITGNFICSRAGEILDCNPAFLRMFGFLSREEALSSSVLDIYADPSEREELLARLEKEKRLDGHERLRKRKDGSPIPVIENVIGVFDDRGSLVGTKGYMIDNTERKRAEEALKRSLENLEQSNADLERFAYVASHDLQEPVRMITSYAQLLRRRYGGRLDADADDFIGFIEQGGRRMQALIADLLEYSRIHSRATPFEPTDAGAVLREALEMLKLSIEEKHVAVTQDPLPPVLADPSQLRQVFQNLVGNAIKFGRADTPAAVHISARGEGDTVRFSVADNGIGIEPEHREKIFDLFQRLHGRERYEGTGIGLAIVKRIVERHGGGIWVESEPGKGSTFHFTLPAARQPVPQGRDRP